MALRLRVGATYLDRDGILTIISKRATPSIAQYGYAFIGVTSKGQTFSFTHDGFFYADKTPDTSDLVKRVN